MAPWNSPRKSGLTKALPQLENNEQERSPVVYVSKPVSGGSGRFVPRQMQSTASATDAATEPMAQQVSAGRSQPDAAPITSRRRSLIVDSPPQSPCFIGRAPVLRFFTEVCP